MTNPFGTVYWAELQKGLTDVGLEAIVDLPLPDSPWYGKIDDLPFIMTIPPKSEEGYRDWLIVSLFGQEEKSTIEKLNRFMRYSAFCKYQSKNFDEAAKEADRKVTGTFEWDKIDPKGRLEEISKDSRFYNFERIEAGFQPTNPEVNFSDFYGPRITIQEISEIEKRDNNSEKVTYLLPFLRQVKPFLAKNQSMFGLSIISLEGEKQNEEVIIRYGLEPLKQDGVLTENDVKRVVNWFSKTEPTWDSGNNQCAPFKKSFEIEGKKYQLRTDCYRGCRDLNLII